MPMKEDRRGWGAATGGTRALPKGRADYFKLGDWNARCWTCYAKRKASEMRKLAIWDGGGWVCERCFETTNPQQFVRGIPDRQNVPWSQPTQPPAFVGSSLSSGQQISGSQMTGVAMTGSVITG